MRMVRRGVKALITPSGIASIAARVEIGAAQLAGVARSSRTGTKRKVKAGPTRRLPVSPENGIGPLIQQRRMPFFSSIVVMVAVVTFSILAMMSGARLKDASGLHEDARRYASAPAPATVNSEEP